MRLTSLLLVVVLVLICAKSAGATMPAPVDFQRVMMGAHMSGLSGRETVKVPVAISSDTAGMISCDLEIDYTETFAGAVSFSRQPDGGLVLESITAPLWMLSKAREDTAYEANGLIDAALQQALAIAGEFTGWLDSQTETVGAQPSSTSAVPEELRPAYVAATLTVQGRLATVTLDGWNLLLEARQKDNGWVLEVIAFEEVATP